MSNSRFKFLRAKSYSWVLAVIPVLIQAKICTDDKRTQPPNPQKTMHIQHFEYIFEMVKADGVVDCKEIDALKSAIKAFQNYSKFPNDALDGCESEFYAEIEKLQAGKTCAASSAQSSSSALRETPVIPDPPLKEGTLRYDSFEDIDAIKEPDRQKSFEEDVPDDLPPKRKKSHNNEEEDEEFGSD